jgi:hypothetical protein
MPPPLIVMVADTGRNPANRMSRNGWLADGYAVARRRTSFMAAIASST